MRSSAKPTACFLKDPHILARAVIVVDKHNTVRYLQVTPELAQLPDMDAAFRFAPVAGDGELTYDD
ncbi:MAG: hypothetical protein KatS3mg082_1103 [Nitrospiraceae bacterium]|nr:MAG: hypothetical protein KatS3mg082_1103 [Nitrospiraceae bacterium]